MSWPARSRSRDGDEMESAAVTSGRCRFRSPPQRPNVEEQHERLSRCEAEGQTGREQVRGGGSN